MTRASIFFFVRRVFGEADGLPGQAGNDTPRAALALALVVAGMLSACSDIYYDRRETVAHGADDHIASNRVAQMIDPWPAYVGNKNLRVQRRQNASSRRPLSAQLRDPAIPHRDNGTRRSAADGAGLGSRLPSRRHEPDDKFEFKGTNSQWSSQTTTQYAPPAVANKKRFRLRRKSVPEEMA